MTRYLRMKYKHFWTKVFRMLVIVDNVGGRHRWGLRESITACNVGGRSLLNSHIYQGIDDEEDIHSYPPLGACQ